MDKEQAEHRKGNQAKLMVGRSLLMKKIIALEIASSKRDATTALEKSSANKPQRG